MCYNSSVYMMYVCVLCYRTAQLDVCADIEVCARVSVCLWVCVFFCCCCVLLFLLHVLYICICSFVNMIELALHGKAV